MAPTRRSIARAFTLIELLVVIAIIAILTAILLPVFASVREGARQSTSISNMKDIQQKMAQFKLDNHRYPDVLFGYYVSSHSGNSFDNEKCFRFGAGDGQCPFGCLLRFALLSWPLSRVHQRPGRVHRPEQHSQQQRHEQDDRTIAHFNCCSLQYSK